MSEVKKPEIALVEAICARLKIGDEGKIRNFFQKQIKVLSTNVKSLDREIDSLQHNLNVDIDLINDRIEDANEEYNDAYFNITPEDVSTNEKQREFAPFYFAKIDKASSRLKELKDEIIDLREKVKDSIKEKEAEKNVIEEMINKIKNYKKS